jgi:arylformamidase
MSPLIDISVALRPEMVTWPDSAGMTVERTKSFERGDGVTVSRIVMDVHCGTHVEAPLHFVDGGSTLDEFPLDTFVGPAYVASVGLATSIGPADLEAANIPQGIERLLLRTANSEPSARSVAAFRPTFAALSPAGAEWVVGRGIRLIGADYLSVARFDQAAETHRVLMTAGIAILEGLDLGQVAAGSYRLICTPLRIDNVEAAPARALLERAL